jgi:hypothetical protein
MERGHRFNTAHFISEIINGLATSLKATWKFPDKKWYRLHLDNVRPHTSQCSADYIDRHMFIRLFHPPFSPDLAPSHFYLFRKKGEACEMSWKSERRAFSKCY